jgi:myo-inositol-1(or 4)-monophosphatase
MDKLEFAMQLARETGKLLMEYFNPTGTTGTLKPDRSILTEADLAADDKIAASIKQNFPDDVLISEELRPTLDSGDMNPSKSAWVVDPLDGTTNFSLGLPIWGVSIAHLVDGMPDAAAVYFPLFDELYTTHRGAGASLNGAPIKVVPPGEKNTSTFFSCCSRTHRLYDVKIRYKPRILGSAAYTFCAVARGMAVVGFEATPKIWDIAGGWLLVNEANGFVDTHDGLQPFPITPGTDYRLVNFPTIMAASPQLLDTARQQISPRSRG